MSESDFVFCNLPPRGNSVSGWITSTNQFVELTQKILGNMRLSGCSLFTQEGKDVFYGNYKSTVINEDFSLKITPHIVGGNHFLVESKFDEWLESKLAIAENGNVIVLYASDWTLEDKLKYMGSFSGCLEKGSENDT